jgi:hypothetical protein
MSRPKKWKSACAPPCRKPSRKQISGLKFYFPSVFCALAFAASAATSTSWEINGFGDFLKGRLSNLSLSADGLLELGPAVRSTATLGQPALWSLAAAPDGSLYAGTGHSGKVYKLTPGGQESLVWSAQQSEIFALWVDAKGILYAGTSPNGSLYRLENGTAREIWRAPAKYIWAIQPAPGGSLFVATGEPGRVYRIDPSTGTADLYYETGQANVTTLASGPNGHLLAGTDPNGILYEISAPKQATILLDSTLPEIRSIAVDSHGVVYAAAMGGAVSTRSPPTAASAAASGAVVAGAPTVITVTEARQSGLNVQSDQSGLKAGAGEAKPPSPATPTTPSAPSVVEVSGVEKSAIYRIGPDHAIETIRSSKESNVYDLLVDADNLVFSTDEHARIYRWNDGRTTLLAEPGDGETTRLLQVGANLFAALSNPGRIIAFGPAGSSPGSYQSPVHDSTSVARWGHLQWRGNGAAPNFRTRTGNTARPDATWSPWSEPLTMASSPLIKSPAARFIQWRAEFPAGSHTSVDTVSIPYLPRNGPPAVRSVTVTSVINTNPLKSGAANTSASAAYSITVTDTGEAPVASTATSASQSISRLQTTQTQVSWQADDPDSDKLVYSLYFRAEDAANWQLIRSRMFENALLLDPDVFADGRYYFKVVASDAPSNSAEFARQAELISPPILIDNTPPVVTLGAPKRGASTLDMDIEGNDTTSPLRLCEYSLDAGFWQPIESNDGVTDSPREHFHLHLDALRPGEHLVVFRVYDTSNNAGLARIVLH